jgi:hypothetical protein
MEPKITVIELSLSKRETAKDINIMLELQTVLFHNGCRWSKKGKEVKKYFSESEYLVIIDKTMYTMSWDSIEYLKRKYDVHYFSSVLTYFRHLKLKKLNIT